MPDSSLYVVVPAYNEAGAVGRVVGQLKDYGYQVVVVDDGSVDGTGQIARDSGATVLTHLLNRGQGAALKTGIDYALGRGADVIVTFDGDGQHRAEEIARVAEPILAGRCDVVLGSRFMDGQSQVPPLRKLVLKAGVLFTRVVSHIRVTDTHNGFRAFSSLAARQIGIRQARMAHASEILDEIGRLGLRYCEVPTRISYTDYSGNKGQSSLAAFRIVVDFLMDRRKR